jgi:hypothetical protein
MSLWLSILVPISFVALAFHYWDRLSDLGSPHDRRFFPGWVGKGVVWPVLIWVALNVGISDAFPSMNPRIALAKSGGGNWMIPFSRVVQAGVFVIVTWWTAVTFAWMEVEIVLRTEARKEFWGILVVGSVLLLPLCAVLIYFLGWPSAGFALLVLLVPLVHFSLPIVSKRVPVPAYSRALAKIKFGKYQEAEWEVIRELERFEDDFEGWMMLAELYANQFHDLVSAEETVLDLLAQPNVNVVQSAIALHRLADWHLKLAQDPDGARWALEQISARAPGSHLDKMARLRIGQLPSSKREMIEQAKGKTIPLPPAAAPGDVAAPPLESGLPREEALARANQCVENLRRDPNDVPAREELARLFMHGLGQLAQAVEQMELLVGMPDQPAEKVVEWLGLMAVWHLKFGGDAKASGQIMGRLVESFPNSPRTWVIQRRIKLIEAGQRLGKLKMTPARTTS